MQRQFAFELQVYLISVAAFQPARATRNRRDLPIQRFVVASQRS